MIGKVIQEKRKAVGLTQAQLAERLGVTPPAVNRWEKDLSFPDAALLAPLARLLKTDINTLFSFYDALSPKERELIVDRARTLFMNGSDEDALKFIDEAIRQNLSDGYLYKDLASAMYGIHVWRKASGPAPFLQKTAEYYERAMELLPEYTEDISYKLISIYSELSEADKAEIAWSRLPESKHDKKWAHAEMLYSLKNYDAAVPEIKESVLRKIIGLSTDLNFLKDALSLNGDTAIAKIAEEKASCLRNLFGLWEGFEVMSHISSAFSVADADAESAHLSEFLQLNTSNAHISSCPLFADVVLGGASKDESTSADLMADIMNALKKL